MELSNNRAERTVKEMVMGRKNWLFSNSLEGATSSGIILSVLKTAMLNNLNLRKYCILLCEEIPNISEKSDEQIQDYLPWSKKVQDTCRK